MYTIVDNRDEAVEATKKVQAYLSVDPSPVGLQRAIDDLLKPDNRFRADVVRALSLALAHPYDEKTCGDRTRVAYGLNAYGVGYLRNAWDWLLLAVQHG